MKIISNFRDYYDNCKGAYNDPNILYSRDYPVISNNSSPIVSVSGFTRSYQARPWSIFFCGKIYRLIMFEISKRDKYSFYQKNEVVFSYSLEEATEIIKEIDLHTYNELLSDKKVDPFFSAGQRIKDFYTSKPNIEVYEKTALIEKSPVVIFGDFDRYDMYFGGFEKTVTLEMFQFYKVVHCVDAYHLIEKYLSNELAIENQPQQNIPDKYMIEQKGFDNKTSFRKTVDQRPRKRRKK